MPSFSITCSARAAFSVLGELARLALADQGVAARLGALAADLVGGDDGDGGVEDRLHPALEQQRHLDHGDLGVLAAASRARRRSARPTRGWICASSQVSSSGSAKTISPIWSRSTLPLGRDLLPPALDQAPQQRLGIEQLVHHRVAGDRRRASRSKAASASDFPAAIPPVSPIVSGKTS